MHPVMLIQAACSKGNAEDAPEMPDKTTPGVCCVTGEFTDTVPRKTLLGKSFTDGALLRVPSSDRVGLAAWTALSYKWERMSSWVCTADAFTRLLRVDVRDAVFGPLPDVPWSGYATTSYKKHGALRAVVNTGKRNVWLFETRLVDCSDRPKLEDWWTRINAALRLGFGRKALETLECPAWVMAKVGVDAWLEYLAWAKPIQHSALYSFLCYLLPSQDELKAERAA